MRGLGVSPGFAVGPAVLVNTVRIDPPGEKSTNPNEDIHRINEALDAVAAEMQRRAETAPDEVRQLLIATSQMADDDGLRDAAAAHVAAGEGPVDALFAATEEYCVLLAQLDEYMAERQEDLRDVCQRAAAHMMGMAPPGIPELEEPSILVAEDLAPADTAELDPKRVLGIITERGGVTSHTAILAAQLGIPAVVSARGILDLAPTRVGVDGTGGEIIIDPDEATVADFRMRGEVLEGLAARAEGPGRTKDGHAIQILANVGTEIDALEAARFDVEGVGLFRTEFLFIDRPTAPTFDEQLCAYRKVFEAFAPRKVVVRTLDAGADKPLKFVDLGPEENPALGVRGFRLQRRNETLLNTQLEAIAQAAVESKADVWVMAPMVATVEEARYFSERCRAVGLNTVGTMVEVPAVVMRSERVMRHCDFSSIGTNDLSQYLFAADRMDGRLSDLLTGWQPALWAMIVSTVEGAGGKPVGICGEVGGNPELALLAAGAGITSLSMAPNRVAMVKAMLASHTMKQCRAMLAAVLDSDDSIEAKERVRQLVVPEIVAALG